MPEVQEQREEKLRAELNRLKRRYGLDFAGNLDKIFRGETLYRTIEYMRKHYADDPAGSGSGNDSR